MLQKQVLSIAAMLGLDTKNAPALVAQNKFLQLTNAVFGKPQNGGIDKRNGYSQLPHVDTLGNTLAAGQSLVSYGNEQDLIAGGNFYSLPASQGAWLKRGTVTNIVPTETAIVDNNYIQSNCDSVTSNGVTVYAWEDTRGGVWYKVIDETTGSVLLTDTQLLATGIAPRVVINGTNLSIFCASSTSAGIWHGEVNVLSPSTPATAVQIISATSLATPFEVLLNQSSGKFAIAYGNASGFITLANLAAGSLAVTFTTTYGTTGPATALTMCVTTDGLLVTWATPTSAGSLYSVIVQQDAVNTVVYAVQATVLGGSVSNILSYPVSPGVSAFILQREPAGANDRLLYSTLNNHATPAVFTIQRRGLAICSLPLVVNGATYFLANFPSPVQQTYFLLNAATFAVVGRFTYSSAGPFPTHRLAQWMNPMGSVWSLAMTVANVFLTSAGGVATDLYGVTKLALDFGQTAVRSDQLGQDLAICGALPQIYDGTNIVEGGFHQYPEQMVAATQSSNLAIINPVKNAFGYFTSYTLAFPTNPVNPGADGVMLVPGDYFVAGTGGELFYWNVDGKTPSHPTTGPSAGTWNIITVNSSDSAATLATKTAAVISPTVSGTETLAVVGSQINFTASSGVVPQLRTQFEVAQTAVGSSTLAGQVNFNCVPAFMIQPGQYFYYQVYNHTTLQNNYVWFTVNGIGTDPNPFNAGWVGTQVAILSSDTETNVATKLAAALNAVTSTSSFVTATTAGSAVGLVNGYVGATSALASPGNVGLGAIGVNTSTSAAYQWVAVYEWVDAKGQLHRSAPSVPVTVGIGGFGLQNGVVQLTVKTLRLTQKQNVDIAIYRTSGNGTVFQRVTSSLTLLYNVPGQDAVTFSDNVSDVALASGEFLYTTGGVAQNDQPPAMTQVHSHLDRLWASGLEDPQLLWWSKFYATGVAVEWSALQTTRIDASAGPILKLMSMDGNLIVFCANQTWVIAGSGPTAANQGTQFAAPQQITSSVSIRDPQSAVLVPQGIIFKSTKGFYLLDRSLQIGQGGINGNSVDSFNADIVTAASVVPNMTEVRFLSATGSTLLYDHQFQQWSQFTNHQGLDSTVFQGTYYYLRSNAAVWQEAINSYLDNITPIPMLMQTAWIKGMGDNAGQKVQAYMRVWKTFFKGYFPAGCQLQIALSTNYNPTPIDTRVFTGSGMQIRYDNAVQLCEAFQITIQDLNPDPAGVQSWNLDAIDFEVGVRKGLFKVGALQEVG